MHNKNIYIYNSILSQELLEIAIERCFLRNEILSLPQNAIFSCNKTIDLKCDIIGNNTTLLFKGEKIESLCRIERYTNIQGIIIDGKFVNDVKNGLFVKANMKGNSICKIDISIKNIRSYGNHDVNGISVYKNNTYDNLKNRFNIRAKIENIIAGNNNIIGDLPGSSTGISYYCSHTSASDELLIEDCIINNIQYHEDSCGIYVGNTHINSKNKITINNCRISNALKRGIKIQHSNVLVRNCYVQNSSIAFDTYSPHTIFEECNGNNCQIFFRISSDDSSIMHSHITSKSLHPLIEIISAKNVIIKDVSLSNSITLPNKDHSIIYINEASVSLNNLSIKGFNKSGSSVVIQGNSKIKIINCEIFNTDIGVYSTYSTGEIKIEATKINNVNYGIKKNGIEHQLIIAETCIIDTYIVAFDLYSETSNAQGKIFNCVITSKCNGIIIGDNCSVINNIITNNYKKGTGIQIGESTATNNTVRGFDIGISYPFQKSRVTKNKVSNFNIDFMTK